MTLILKRVINQNTNLSERKMEKIRKLSLHNYWDSSTSEDRVEIVERAFKMIEKQKEYIDLLNKELTGLVGMAAIHGWRSDLVNDGIRLRYEMTALSGEEDQPKP